MSADRILAAMLAIAPHDNPSRMQPIANTIERVASGPSEQAMLVALWFEGGQGSDNPFRLRPTDRRLALGDWRMNGSWGPSLDSEAGFAVRLFRGAFRMCPSGARTPMASQLAYYQGRPHCMPIAWDLRIAHRAETLRPVLGGQ